MPESSTVTLTLDLGSTHFKARIYRGIKPLTPLVQVAVATTFDRTRAEIQPHLVERAFLELLKPLRDALSKVDAIIFANQAPSLCVLDAKGNFLHPVITHLDRRSVEEARELTERFTEKFLLVSTKNLPIPGGIASTSLRWMHKEYPRIVKKAALVGSLNTYFLKRLTGFAAIDPGNATYLGLLANKQKLQWDTDIATFCGVQQRQLPRILNSDEVIGTVRPEVARRLGFTKLPKVLVGMMDSSSCIAAVEHSPGDLFHLSGTTDVLAAVTKKPMPSEFHLTRHLGFDNSWLSVRAISAGGATLWWGKNLFGVDPLAVAKKKTTDVRFLPYLAGDRLSLENRDGGFSGLTLATTKEDLAIAIRTALGTEALASFDQIQSVVKKAGLRLSGKVWCSGGNSKFADYVHRLWKKNKKLGFQFVRKEELNMVGLASLASRKEAT